MATRGLGREQVAKATYKQERYPHPLFSCMMPMIAISLLLGLSYLGFQLWQSRLPRDTTIPPVAGLTQEEARRELQRFTLTPKVVLERQRSEEIPAGSVITSEPSAGRRVKVGRVVHLIISDGSSYTTVPDVRELTVSAAVQRLRDYGLQVTRETYAPHATIPFDRVIEVSPIPDTKVKQGSQVALVISKGEPERRSRRSEPELNSSVITLTLPTDTTEEQEARIEVKDEDGFRIVYQETRKPGSQLVYTVQGRGDTTVTVYYGTRLLLTRTL